MNYKKAYYVLFNTITEALDKLDKVECKKSELENIEVLLQNIQLRTEDMYIDNK